MNDPYGNHEFGLSKFLSDKDVLTRHKWPEEKPPISGSRYLVLIDREYTSFIDILFWGGSDWMRFKHNDDRILIEADDDVTHWWNLPEVTE